MISMTFSSLFYSLHFPEEGHCHYAEDFVSAYLIFSSLATEKVTRVSIWFKIHCAFLVVCYTSLFSEHFWTVQVVAHRI